MSIDGQEVFGVLFLAVACLEFYGLGFVEDVRRAAWLERLRQYLSGAGMMCMGTGRLLPGDSRLALPFAALGLGLVLASFFASFAHRRRLRIADSPR